MNIEIFVLCDAASEAGGKLFIMGVFDTIFAPELPAKHPACTILVKLRFKQPEAVQHNVSVELTDDKGELLIPKYENSFQVKIGEDGYAATNFIMNVQNLILNKYCQNTVKLTVDGKLLASTPLFVKQPSHEKK